MHTNMCICLCEGIYIYLLAPFSYKVLFFTLLSLYSISWRLLHIYKYIFHFFLNSCMIMHCMDVSSYSQFPIGGLFDYFQSFALTNSVLHLILLYIYLFVFFPVCLWDRVLKVGLLHHRINADIFLLEIAKFLSFEVEPLYIVISNIWESLIHFTLTNRLCCQTVDLCQSNKWEKLFHFLARLNIFTYFQGPCVFLFSVWSLFMFLFLRGL